MSTADRRTIEELLAESEALARDPLLDATLEHAPSMVRSWNQLVGGSAAELWAVLISAPNSPSGSDPMERLRAVGEAIGRSVTSGHWPGHGPTDEHLTQIADNFSRARHLVERHGRPSALANPERNADSRHAQGQVMHTLYVTAHGTAVALGAYVANLQDRRGLINVADDVIATTNRAVAAVAQNRAPATSRDQSGPILRRAADTHSSPFRSTAHKNPAPKGPRR